MEFYIYRLHIEDLSSTCSAQLCYNNPNHTNDFHISKGGNTTNVIKYNRLRYNSSGGVHMYEQKTFVTMYNFFIRFNEISSAFTQ